MHKFIQSYGFSLLLLLAIGIGSLLGAGLGGQAVLLKPFGDFFLHLLFTAVVPLVFFSLSSAVASMSDLKRLGKIMGLMMLIFICTGIVSSVVMLVTVKYFSPSAGVHLNLPSHYEPTSMNVADNIVNAFTVNDFSDLLSKKNMLALIVFAVLIGLSASMVGAKAKVFIDFLVAGNEVMTKFVGLIMYYAPVGLGAYFGYLVGTFGPQLLGAYFKVVAIYYPVALAYFFIAFSIYALICNGFVSFWKNIVPVSLTAWATGSSVATIPTNIAAAKRIGIPQDVRDVIIPVGATIHMEGSCLSAILKISLLFGIFGMDFSGPWVYITAISIALLSGTVMSGIPGGGFLGELLIVTMYGFPIEALPIISMVGTLVDPPATMVNAVGDNVSAMMVSRLMYGKKWQQKTCAT